MRNVLRVFLLLVLGVLFFNTKNAYAYDDMYSYEPIYAENNYSCDLFEYKYGCMTIKQAFFDNFMLCSRYQGGGGSTGSASTTVMPCGESLYYNYNSTYKYWSCTDGGTTYTKYRVDDYTGSKYTNELAKYREILTNLKDNAKPLYTLTVEDGVTKFPSLNLAGEGLCFYTSNHVRNIVIPKSVKYLGDYGFHLTCAYNLVCESDKITEFPLGLFSCSHIINADFSKLDGKLRKIGDWCFYQLNSDCGLNYNRYSLTNPDLDVTYKVSFGLPDDFSRLDFNFVLPVFSHVSDIGYHVFHTADFNNNIIDFSNNTSLVEGFSYSADNGATESSGSYTGMFTGVIAKEIHLNNCKNLQLIGSISYVDTYLIDMSGCDSIYACMPSFDANSFYGRRGFSNFTLYFTQCDEVIFPESLMVLSDYSIAYCSFSKMDTGMIKFVMGDPFMYFDEKKAYSTNLNYGTLDNRGMVLFPFKELDFHSVRYWGMNVNNFYGIGGAPFNDEVGESVYLSGSKTYDESYFKFIPPEELTWVDTRLTSGGNASTVVENTVMKNGMCEDLDSTISVIEQMFRKVKVSKYFMLPKTVYKSSKYSVTKAPDYGFMGSTTGGYNYGSNLSLTVLKMIYENGIEDFESSFQFITTHGDPDMIAKLCDYGISAWGYNHGRWNYCNSVGIALVYDELSDNIVKTHDLITANNSYGVTNSSYSSRSYSLMPLMYLSSEYIDSINVSVENGIDLSNYSDEFLQNPNQKKLKKLLKVEAEYSDGHEEEIFDYDIDSYDYNSGNVELSVSCRNLPVTYTAENYCTTPNYKQWLDVDSEDFHDLYDFTYRYDNLNADITRGIDGISINGSDKAYLGHNNVYTSELEYHGYLDDSTVTWNVTGGTTSSIDDNGVLVVPETETSDTLTVTVVSNADNSITASKTVKVCRQVNSINVSGRTTLMPNAKASYTAKDGDTLLSSQDIVWSVEGNTSTKTTISDDGLLVLGSNEDSTVLSIKATNGDTIVGSLNVNLIYGDIGIQDEIQVNKRASFTVPQLEGVNTELAILGETSESTKLVGTSKLYIGEDESAESLKLRYRNKDNPSEFISKTIGIKQRVDSVNILNEYYELERDKTYDYTITVTGSPNASNDVLVEVLNDKGDVVFSKQVSGGTYILDTYSLKAGKSYRLKASSVVDASVYDTTSFNIQKDDTVQNITNNITNNYYEIVSGQSVTEETITNNYYTRDETNNHYESITGSGITVTTNNYYEDTTVNNHTELVSGGSTVENNYYYPDAPDTTVNNHYNDTTNNYHNDETIDQTINNHYDTVTNNYNSTESSVQETNNHYNDVINNHNVTNSSVTTENNYHNNETVDQTINNHYDNTVNNYDVTEGAVDITNNYHNDETVDKTVNNHYDTVTNNHNVTNSSVTTENNYHNDETVDKTVNNHYDTVTNNHNVTNSSVTTENNYHNDETVDQTINNYYDTVTNNHNVTNSSVTTENNYHNDETVDKTINNHYDTVTNNHNVTNSSITTENNYHNDETVDKTVNNHYDNTVNNYDVTEGAVDVTNNYNDEVNNDKVVDNYYDTITNNHNVTDSSVSTVNNYTTAIPDSMYYILNTTNNYVTQADDISVEGFENTLTAKDILIKGGTNSKDTEITVDATKDSKEKQYKKRVGGILYKTVGNYATVLSSDKNIKTANIKEKVVLGGKTYKVKTISDNAFSGRTKLKSVTMSRYIRTIEDSAFSNCKSLKKVKFKTRFVKFKYHSFYKCIGLTKLTLNGRRIEVQYKAFDSCKKLSKVKLKGIKIVVRNKGFYKCKRLGKVKYKTFKDECIING